MEISAKNILKESYIVDMHNDMPMHVYTRRKNGEKKVIETNYLEDIKKGGVKVILCVLFLTPNQLDNPLKYALEQLIEFKEDIDESKDKIEFCTSYKQVMKAIQSNRLAIMLGFEGLEPIEDSKLLLKVFYDLGVRFCGLNWSRDNLVSDGCGFEKTEPVIKVGLSQFGREIVKYAEELGMIIDVTHISEKGFWDVLSMLEQPCIASHTNAQGVHHIMRNFTDEQLIAIKKTNSIVGITGVSQFVKDIDDDKYPTIDDYIYHIDYVRRLIGINHIGIGLDLFKYFYNHKLYDLPKEFGKIPPDTIDKYENLELVVEKLIKLGYSYEEISSVLGNNFLNIIKNRL